ncbi:hypothetical protein JW916_10245 [Candidatus Sumerlaeota bacterium]|nr:hypothetical protein [Candidatus Sumerlaeota bacterium]
MSLADATTPLPGSIHLSGCDWFLLAVDRLAEGAGPSSNTCRLVLRLDGRLGIEALRQALDSSPLAQWMARVRRVSLTPLVLPAWSVGPPNGGIPASERSGPTDPPADLPAANLGLRPDRASCLRFDLVQGSDEKSSVVLSWHHAMMDAHGAEFLLCRLGGNGSGETEPNCGNPVVPNPPLSVKRTMRDVLSFPNRLRVCRQSSQYICNLSAGGAIARLMDRRDAVGRRFENFSHSIDFDPDETARIDARATETNAAFRKSLFYLASTVRAVHSILKKRQTGEGNFLVPVPRDSRKRGARGPVVSNQSSFLFYLVRPEETGDLAALVASLGRQMKDQIRDNVPGLFSEMMAQFRRLPLPIYSRLLSGPTRGQMASFYFSDTGEVCADLDRFLGLPVEGIAHLPASAFPPGLTVSFTRCQGRQQAVVSWSEGCLDAEELALLERHLRRDLLEGGRE